MKRSGTIAIFMVVWAAVLFVAFVIGICIREIRFQRAKAEVGSVKEGMSKVSGKALAPMETETERLVKELAQREPVGNPRGGGERGAEAGEGRRGMRGPDRFANMSEEERIQMRERFGSRGRGRRGDMSQLSEEERARFEEERRQMRERIQNMSEEERREYFSQMREGGGRGGRDRGEDDNTEAEQEENN